VTPPKDGKDEQQKKTKQDGKDKRSKKISNILVVVPYCVL